MRRLLPIVLACSLALLAACGKEDEPTPHIFAVKAPRGSVPVEIPEAGMSFERPANWALRRRDPPGVFELTSGEALVSAWAYAREEPLPETPEELDAAKGRLVDAIKKRDPEYVVRSADLTEVAGSPAIEVRGEQVVSGLRLRTTSVHAFNGATEYVIEAIAPPRDNRLVDSRVLAPLLDSLSLEGDLSQSPEGG